MASTLSFALLGCHLTTPLQNQAVNPLSDQASASDFKIQTTTTYEFQVNAYATGEQVAPAVAMDSAGDYVVVWDNRPDSVYGDIYAQRYAANGGKLGSEFRVNTYTTSSQSVPATAMADDGAFVVVWQSYEQDGHVTGIYGQRYDSSGSAQGSEFRVNTYTMNYQSYPTVAMDSDGDFVVAWQSFGQDGHNYGIFAQRYDSTGGAQGSEFQINTYTHDYQSYSAVGMDASGDYVAVWQSSDDQDGDGRGIFGKRYNSSGIAQAVP